MEFIQQFIKINFFSDNGLWNQQIGYFLLNQFGNKNVEFNSFERGFFTLFFF